MKGIDSTGAHFVHVPVWMDGWMDGWIEVKAVLRIAYSNQKDGRRAQISSVGHKLLYEIYPRGGFHKSWAYDVKREGHPNLGENLISWA
jgi:hypothetical protein